MCVCVCVCVCVCLRQAHNPKIARASQARVWRLLCVGLRGTRMTGVEQGEARAKPRRRKKARQLGCLPLRPGGLLDGLEPHTSRL